MTKKAITDKCREILAQTPQQHEVTGVDRDLLLALLDHHPDKHTWPLSRQGQVVKITVARWAGAFHTRCFYLHYANGEVWDFSFHKCIRNTTQAQVTALCQTFSLK